MFEGAQGLGLDQELGHFPHVTRSRTGLPNISVLMNRSGLKDKAPLWAIYVTRTYATRHGAGPLSDEDKWDSSLVLIDNTNQTNEWQGEFRYAPINFSERSDWIQQDLQRIPTEVAVEPSLAITHMDQVPEFPMEMEIELRKIDRFEAGFGLPIEMVSYGPTAEDIDIRLIV